MDRLKELQENGRHNSGSVLVLILVTQLALGFECICAQ